MLRTTTKGQTITIRCLKKWVPYRDVLEHFDRIFEKAGIDYDIVAGTDSRKYSGPKTNKEYFVPEGDLRDFGVHFHGLSEISGVTTVYKANEVNEYDEKFLAHPIVTRKHPRADEFVDAQKIAKTRRDLKEAAENIYNAIYTEAGK